MNAINTTRWKLLSLLFLLFIGALGGTLLQAQIVRADGEQLKWVDQNNIVISGGNLASPGTITFSDTNLTPDGYVFRVTLSSDQGECTRPIYARWQDAKNDPQHLTLYADPYVGPVIGQPGSTPQCDDNHTFGGRDYSELYQNIVVTISNERPGQETSEETDAQKVAPVRVCSFLDGSPDKLKITITQGSATASFTADNSVEGEPAPIPDLDGPFVPNAGCYGVYEATFYITPGKWKICATVKGKTGCQSVNKEKYKPADTTVVEIGNSPESPFKTIVEAIVQINNPDITSLTEDQSLGVYDLELKNSSGKVIQKASQAVDYDAGPCQSAQQEASDAGTTYTCDPGGSKSGYTEFKNVPAGKYKICIAGTTKCVSLTKKRDERSRNNKIVLSMDEAKKYDTSGAFTGGDSASNCAIDGIGWIICPVMNFMGIINDKAFTFLEKLLTVRPALITDKSTIAAWSTFRDLANVAFVIAFLVVLYSQLTSVGISNYGIKKLLPRIVVIAILVNLSYYICAIAVDVSNIVGTSIYSLLGSAIDVGTSPSGGYSTWAGIMGTVLAVAAGALLLIMVFAAPMALLAVGVVLLILIARQAFVIILIVIAPLAFVAYLLPNTEDLFKKWRKAFVAVLMVYPIVGLVFGGSTLASQILMNVASNNGNSNGNSDDQILLSIVALTVLAIPLFAIPVILKGSMSAAGSIGAKLSGLSDRSNSYAKKKVMDGRIGEAREAFGARKQARQVNRRVGEGFGSGVNKAIDRSRVGRYLGGNRGAAAATSAYHKAAHEEVERQGSMMSELPAIATNPNDEDLFKILTNKNNTAERRAAAAERIAQVGGDQHVQKAFDYLAKQGAEHALNGSDKDIGDVQQLAAGALLKRKPAGISTNQASSLQTGNLESANGYYGQFKGRIAEGKFGAGDYAAMRTDDLVRLAEMSSSTDPAIRLSDEDIAHVQEEFDKVALDETLKGTMTEERKNLISQIAMRAPPKKLTGRDYGLADITT